MYINNENHHFFMYLMSKISKTAKLSYFQIILTSKLHVKDDFEVKHRNNSQLKLISNFFDLSN